jgi:DNA-binding IclR family transcriptional regulator
MRRVREVLRLRTAGVGLNEIARRVGVALSTVRLMLQRLASAGPGRVKTPNLVFSLGVRGDRDEAVC